MLNWNIDITESSVEFNDVGMMICLFVPQTVPLKSVQEPLSSGKGFKGGKHNTGAGNFRVRPGLLLS